MRYELPAATFHARVDGFDTGLTGTVGVRIINSSGTDVVARTTSGIIENPVGSGSYLAELTAPSVSGDYSIFWDGGTVAPGTTTGEALVVTVSPPTPSAANAYITVAALKDSLTLNGTSYADDDVERAVNAANAAIDQLFGRGFLQDADPSDRYYGIRQQWTAVREIRDLTRVTTITVSIDTAGNGTFSTDLVENTDYVLEPLNAELDGIPFEQIRSIRGCFPRGSRVMRVTGTHGWPDGPPPQIIAFAEVIATKLVTRFREAPFGIVTAGADMGVAMRMAQKDPDFSTLSAGLTRGAMIA